MSLEDLGIKRLEDLKDGTVFVLLGCEILGSEEKKTCKDHVYIKIGNLLLNQKGWFPLEAYDTINNSFYLKKETGRFVKGLEYEIMAIYDFEDSIHRLDFDEIYKMTKTKTPIWRKDVFCVSNLSIEDYFLNNFDVDVFVDNRGEE